MVTHYTLQTKDHKLAIREEDFTVAEFNLICNALKNYQATLEESYKEYMKDGTLPDVVVIMKDVLEDVTKIRRKLSGRE